MEEKIKECPHCGCDEIWIVFIPFEKITSLQCQNCGCLGPRVSKMMRIPESEVNKIAIEKWNERSYK